jgi:hypothetical protein
MTQRDEFSQFDETLGGPDEGQEANPPREEQEEQKAESGVDKRISDLTRERNEAVKMRDEAIRKMLEGAPTRAPEPDPAPKESDDFVADSLPEDTDPEVADVLRPVLAAHEARIRREFEARYGPAITRVERDQNIELIETRVEGFRKELMEDVEEMFKAMSPEEQAEYDNRLGIEALALRAKINRINSGRDFTDMAHSAPSGNTPPDRPRGPSEQSVWDMPDEEFDAWMAKIRTTPRR